MNQHNNLEGGPVPDSDPSPAQEAPPDPMTQLVQAMATLVQVLTMQLASNLSKSKTIQRPSVFKGEHGNARRFLAAYPM